MRCLRTNAHTEYGNYDRTQAAGIIEFRLTIRILDINLTVSARVLKRQPSFVSGGITSGWAGEQEQKFQGDMSLDFVNFKGIPQKIR